MIKINGTLVSPTKFPDKTSQVWNVEKLQQGDYPNILFNPESEDECMHLFQLLHLCEAYDLTPKLDIRWLPYGRQDKYVNNSSCFALHTFIKILRAFPLRSIKIFDLHGNIADLSDFERRTTVTTYYPVALVENFFLKEDFDLVVYPDESAMWKYKDIYDLPYVHCVKTRDQATGKIESIEVPPDVAGKDVLVVDDICDGGATFMALAKKMTEAKVENYSLFVTHGLFTKGVHVLEKAGYHEVYSAHTPGVN